MVKKIQINMSNKLFYMFVTIGLMILLGIGVYAYTTDGSGNPAVMGHSLDEIAPPTGCLGGQVLGWSGTSWQCVDNVAGVASTQFDLVYGIHSSEQCTNLGGAVVTDGADKFCKFNGASCGAGWAQFKSWSASNAKTCSGGTKDCPGKTNCRCKYDDKAGVPGSCTTASHSFSNKLLETCTFGTPYCYYCAGFMEDEYCTKTTCTALYSAIGCY